MSIPRDIQHYLRPGLLQLQSLPPLSLYIHLPWCIQKCPYCDFNSHALSPQTGAQKRLDTAVQDRYLAALLADVDAALPLIWGRVVHSVFLGGGTPSLFSPDHIAQLISDIRARLKLSADCEITLEANPGSFETARFAAFAKAGVNRLSVGVQSFNDAHLTVLGRVHSSTQAKEALAEAAACFDTFNLDLMYALPGQTMDELHADLSCALAFNPPHLSIYHLTIEPNTYFAKFPPKIVDDDDAYDMQDAIVQATAGAGLQRYEVSAFARDGHRCWHNTNYWQFGDYLGIGAGAHSKISFAHRIVRQVRTREPQAYMNAAIGGNAITIDEEIKHKALAFEFMLNALRLKDGVDAALFVQRTGLTPNALKKGLQAAWDKGLMDPGASQKLQATAKGFDFLNDLQSMFLPDN